MYTTQIDHMNLNQIANSGQCFRWQQINDNTYKIYDFRNSGKKDFVPDIELIKKLDREFCEPMKKRRPVF